MMRKASLARPFTDAPLPMSEPLDYHTALDILLETHEPLARHEDVPLGLLDHRVLAADVSVQHDVPAFDNSAMDGFAVSGNDQPQWRVVHRITAGDAGGDLRLERGQAARIFTGAPIPAGTTAVLMQEHTSLDAERGRVTLQPGHFPAGVPDGLNIRRRAEELRQGAQLLERHQALSPGAIGLLAAQGYTHAPCHARVRVTVFSTGNELAEPGQALLSGQIYDSNRYMIAALMRAEGHAVTDGGILPDQLAATRTALQEAAVRADVIICSGGVSVGEEDHLKAALTQVGELVQWRLFIKPGKPFSWGRIGDCRVFMLPGNPVSSLVTLHQLAMPALRRLSGLPAAQARPWQLQAQAAFTRDVPEPRREFLRVRLQAEGAVYRATASGQQGSAMLSGAVSAHALAEIPPGTRVEPGQLLTVYPLGTGF